jgi:hypothetical protein
MNIRKMIIGCTALLLGANVAWALDGDEAESTIRLMGAADAELPEAVTKVITLPAAVAVDTEAVESAVQARGLATANDKRQRQRRKNGLLQTDEARERSSNMADEAHANRENRGRSGDRPDPGPPDDPGRPDSQ